MATRLLLRLNTFAVLLSAGLGCLGCAKAECHTETWSGTCRLQTVTKVREMELPLPSVAVEAIYRPLSTEGPPLLLPDVRREFVALSRHEQALIQHVTSFPSATCFVNPPPPGQCNPGTMVVEVPEFDATTVQSTPEEDGPKGCAQIDSTSSQDRIQEKQTDAQAVPERFHFGESSAELPTESEQLATAIAERLKQDPTIQCLGVVGQFVRGETLEIAFARAQAVRQLLIEKGVEPERLVALTLDRPMTGASGSTDPASPMERRVSVSILLKLAPGREE